MLVKFDNKNKIAKLNLISQKLLPILNEKENANPKYVILIFHNEKKKIRTYIICFL